ncbi:MAG: PSD1 and planctomycete cytochrome C domain-containing protein [Pirellulaceae bacterium]|nr:PSD1 and planctomycete cytochrome C domain-containing protein [Pirellulaceae bacterium]
MSSVWLISSLWPQIRSLRLLSAITMLVAIAVAGDALADDGRDKIEFNRDIRPILSDHCFACHGPDAKHREADLRVDTEAGLFGSGTEHGRVVRGKLDESELWQRITSTKPDEQMPPPKFSKPLRDEQRKLLAKWIEQGAPWQGHWAFQPVSKVVPPAVEEPIATTSFKSFAVNEIDAFAAKVYQSQGVAPTASADRRTLARRLSFDLLGLPPTPDQVQQFVNDQSPEAYERLVDDLLASPHFGERMAMWWLDLVRYADSVGYHGDQPMSVSPYRDYVIQAFNNNKPFDQFTKEQLAGDLMPEPTAEQQIASGYNRLGMMSAEGGVQPKEYLAKYIAERVRNLGGTWLGVTLGCCECHDHKYDPFSTQEFYQFEAFFADIEEQGLYGGSKWGSEIPVPTAEQSAKKADLESQIGVVRQQLDTPTAALAEAQLAWERTQVPWQTLKPISAASLEGATLAVQDDGTILASGKNPATDLYRLTFENVPENITAIRLEVLPHDSLPTKGPGRAGNGNFVLSEIRVSTQSVGEAGAAEQLVPLQNATATYEQTGAAGGNPYGKWAVAAAIDKEEKGKTWGWAIMEQAGKPNLAIFETTQRIGGAGQRLLIRLDQNLDNPNHTLGHFRISVTAAPQPITAQAGLPADLAEITRKPVADRSDAEARKLAVHYRSIAPLLDGERKRLAELQKQLDALNNSITTTLVTKSVAPRMVRVLSRGNWMDENGKVVEPGFPEVLGGSPNLARRMTRMDLANWVVSRDNPLTARVTMNRIWKLFFGAGLSARLDDLGSQGQWPSHPELLDWLAQQFVDSGWNVKHMIKTMVMSGTYRQASVTDPQLAERDPFNRLLARQARFRLDAEVIRDNALAVSGLLVDEVGGKSVNPYQPPGYWAYLNFPQREWSNGKNQELYRRGVYTHWQRQYLHPSLLAFDAPSREECTADRPRSNTPLQALVLLNDPSYIEAARVLAERTLSQDLKNDAAQVNWLLQTTLNRSPRVEELELLTQLLESHRGQYRSDLDAAKKLIAVGDKPADKRFDVAELAAWTSVTRTVLNLHETITRN